VTLWHCAARPEARYQDEGKSRDAARVTRKVEATKWEADVDVEVESWEGTFRDKISTGSRRRGEAKDMHRELVGYIS